MNFNESSEQVSVHDMSETYMVPLQIMLEANVSSAMYAHLQYCAKRHQFGRDVHAHSLCDDILSCCFGVGGEVQVCIRRNQWHPVLRKRLDEQHCAAKGMGF
jgi:hypothetical protein